MNELLAGSDSQAPEVLAAYEEMAARFESDDPRDQFTYMYSKMRSDYELMDWVDARDKDVLNVGCSHPVDELHYARKIRHWTSVDISHESLRVAASIVNRELHPSLASKFSFQYGDASALPFPDGSFDLSVCLSTLDHLPTPEARQRALNEMARVTRPGGHVIITVPNRWCLPYAAGIRKMRRDGTLHYGFVYLFSPLELRTMGLQAGLQPVRFASSIAPPDVGLALYPAYIRMPAGVVFASLRLFGYVGRRVGYAFRKPAARQAL